MDQTKIITDRIWKQVKDLGINNKRVVEYIVRCSERGGGLAICTLRGIAKGTGRSLATTHQVVKRLKDEGLIEMVANGVYRLNDMHEKGNIA